MKIQIPQDAVQKGRIAFIRSKRERDCLPGCTDHVRPILEAALPAIRAQERERIREALEKLPRYKSELGAEPWMVNLKGILRVLESFND